MNEQTSKIGLVGGMVQDLLPMVNRGFDWDIIKQRYDNAPEGTAMSLHLTDEEGQEPMEEIYLGLADGPQIVILDRLTEEWDYIGAVTMYQDAGARILDPDNDLTPDMARYRDGEVRIDTPPEKSDERVWLVISNVLEIMLESFIHGDGLSDVEADVADTTHAGGDD